MVDRILEKPVYLDRLKKEIEEWLTEERLDVSKTSQERQEIITKKPVKETKTIEVSLTREVLKEDLRKAVVKQKHKVLLYNQKKR